MASPAGTELEFPFPDAPAPGQLFEVSHGIYWLRMPLPIRLNHINLWLIEGESGFSLIDTGWATDENIAIWERVAAERFVSKPVHEIIVTHMHPDHIGLAGWLCKVHGVELYMSRAEYFNCHLLLSYTHEEAPEEAIGFYQAIGYSEAQLHNYRAHFGQFGQFVRSLPHAYHRLQEGDELTLGGVRWQVIIGEGHSPEHVCLYSPERKVLISGDQLLPSITSNTSVWPTEPHANPLEEWLASCQRLSGLIPDDVLVLPAHGLPFRGARTRLEQQIQEIAENLDKLLVFCHEPRRVVDTFPVLFRSEITNGNLMMAAGEGLAYLHCLQARGLVQVEYRDGVGYWQRVAGK